MQKVAKTSADMENENLQKLRAVFPQFVKDGAIDFDALQAFFKKEGVLAGAEKYGLSWAGKSAAFGDIRRPATSTLSPQLDESKNWDTTENIFIEGENLEVLKLLQKKYANPGKIKMIYIDPPYNTGKDFIYTDNFTENKNDYYERTGQGCGGIKLTSNLESNGRYHSDWLTMMYPRLFLARNLLRDDGVIFVSIDDNEVVNLRMIMDEIFGEENFVATFMWKRKKEVSNDSKNVSIQGEYVICYAKTESTQLKTESLSDEYIESSYNEPNNDFPLGKWRPVPITVSKGLSGGGYSYKITTPTGVVHERIWAYPEASYVRLFEEKRIYFGKNNEGIPQRVIYDFESTGKPVSNYWDDVSTNKEGKKEIIEVFGDGFFDTPKPTTLIKKILRLTTDKEMKDITLDFFAGSGTTAHAVMDLNAEDGGNRKWICVQVPEGTGDDSEACKAGYKTISAISRERIRRAGAKIGKGDTGFKAFSLSPSNYSEWNILTDKDDEETLKKQAQLFVEQPLVAGYDEQSVVYEILLKEGFDLNSKVEEIKKGGVAYYQVTDGESEMAVTFAKKLTKDQVEGLGLPKDTTFVCLDSALDDTTKVNIARGLMVKTI